MPKENWFKMDSDFYDDDKVIELQMEHGHAGRSIYLEIIARLRSAENYRLPLNYKTLAWKVRADVDVVKSVVEDFDLFEIDSAAGVFTSDRLLRDMELKDGNKGERIAKAKRAADTRWSGNPMGGCSTVELAAEETSSVILACEDALEDGEAQDNIVLLKNDAKGKNGADACTDGVQPAIYISQDMLGDANSMLGDANSMLGDANSMLGDANGMLGDANGMLGDANSMLGDANGMLGDAKSQSQSQSQNKKESIEEEILDKSVKSVKDVGSPESVCAVDVDIGGDFARWFSKYPYDWSEIRNMGGYKQFCYRAWCALSDAERATCLKLVAAQPTDESATCKPKAPLYYLQDKAFLARAAPDSRSKQWPRLNERRHSQAMQSAYTANDLKPFELKNKPIQC